MHLFAGFVNYLRKKWAQYFQMQAFALFFFYLVPEAAQY